MSNPIELILSSPESIELSISDHDQITFSLDGIGNISGDKSYVHIQNSPSNEWVITHNLNKYPSVTVVDDLESVVVGMVIYTSINSVVVYLNASFSGKAYLN